ncbi:MAG TPA: NAD-dependent epimerase/dehydratase family protein [bacterium]|nr:NAD-dependent epimerase/dehydratase family protein [bacterium]
MAALRILVTGSTGFLGGFVVDAVRQAGHVPLTTARSGGDVAVDLAAKGMVAAVTEALQPDVVLHLAAMSRLAECDADPAAAARVNTVLAEECARRFGARLLFASTDLVFDGRSAPYAESATPSPLSVYGASKAEGEERVRRHGSRVVRLPLLFGPDAHGRGATAQLRRGFARQSRMALYTNEYRTPLHAADAARALVAAVADPDGPTVFHLPGPERVSRWQLGQRFCAVQGLSMAAIEPVECQDPLRPRDVSLLGELRASRSLDEMLLDC